MKQLKYFIQWLWNKLFHPTYNNEDLEVRKAIYKSQGLWTEKDEFEDDFGSYER